MKNLNINELEIGKLYLFRHSFNSKRMIYQPARLVEILEINGRPIPKVEWLLQGFKSTVGVGDGTKAAARLDKSWLKQQMSNRADEVVRLQTEASTLFTVYKEL